MDIYIIDWLTSKIVKCPIAEVKEVPGAGTKVLYKDDDNKNLVGTVLGYPRESPKSFHFIGVLSEQQKEQFEKNQSRAQELFSSFRTKFKAEFPDSVPVTARMNLYGNEIYFYFFAEGRYNFSEFVRAFRPEVGMNFFIYQVGARDRIRLDPRADGMYCASGHGYGLDCKMFHHPMPNIDTDVLVAQQLEGRDMEKMKGLCGKLKCSLAYEHDRYLEESKRYPQRGRIYQYQKEKVKCIGVNMILEEIKIRFEESGKIDKISLEERKSNRQ